MIIVLLVFVIIICVLLYDYYYNCICYVYMCIICELVDDEPFHLFLIFNIILYIWWIIIMHLRIHKDNTL